MANEESKSHIIVYIIGAALVIIALAIFISIRLTTGPKPQITSLFLDESTLTIIPEDESLSLVYCAAKTPSPSNCDWTELQEIELPHEGTYYIFAKNIDTGAISIPSPFEYVQPNYSD